MLPYLQQADRHNFDICLEAAIEAAGGGGGTVARSNFRHLCAPGCMALTKHVAQLRCLSWKSKAPATHRCMTH